MPRYEVSLAYNVARGMTVDIEAASPEEACHLALERAEEDPDGFHMIDYVSPTYVVALIEATANGSVVSDLPVPVSFDECRRIHPDNQEA